MPIQDIALKTYREQRTIETDGKRGSGRSMLAARDDDDDDDDIYILLDIGRDTEIYIYIYIYI